MNRFATRRVLVACAMAVACLPALAQTWPQQPVRVIVPVGPGLVPDAMMRMIGEKLAVQLGKPVVIENKPGAGGIIGVQAMDAAHDGHTALFMFTGVAVMTPLLLKAAKYDILRDFVPIAAIADTSFMLAATNSAPAKTIPEIMKLAEEKPGTVVIGHVGPGSTGNMMAEMLAHNMKGKFNVVGFNPTSGPTALISGDATYYVDGIAAVLPLVKSGKATAVAVLSPNVLPGLEAYKLAKDSIPGTEGTGSFGIVGPKDMSPEAVSALENALKKVLSDPTVVAGLREYAIFPAFSNGADYADRIRREKAQFSTIVANAKIEAQ